MESDNQDETTSGPERYTVSDQPPSVEDYLRLRRNCGLSPFSAEAARRGLSGTLFGVSVSAGDDVIGMGRIIGDGGCFLQIVDIAVEPAHQGRGLGKRIMRALMETVRRKLPATAYVSLLADVPADKLYTQFGFEYTAPRTVGMAYRVR